MALYRNVRARGEGGMMIPNMLSDVNPIEITKDHLSQCKASEATFCFLCADSLATSFDFYKSLRLSAQLEPQLKMKVQLFMPVPETPENQTASKAYTYLYALQS